MKTKMINKVLSVLVMLWLTNAMYAQKSLVLVTGTITNEKSELIMAAQIKEKGTGHSVFTDIKGSFKIKVKHGTQLEVSCLGYANQQLVIPSDNKPMKIVLIVEDIRLEELVVTGYAPVQKRDLVTSVSAMSAKSLKNIPVSSRNYNNDESYRSVDENRFKETKAEPLSTFSLDVDAASYSNARRQINEGNMPNKNSVRVEEFLNYFSYDYQQPRNDDPVKINTETHACPWAKDHLLVRIGVKAKEIPSEELPASNFVFLLDVSGSMSSQNKLPLVISSLKLLVNNLREEDKVSIVVYAGAAGVVLPSTSGDDKQKICDALDNLHAGGSTAGGEGIKLAYDIAKENFIEEGNNRVILCTDGDFNVGVSSNEGLEELIENERSSGVYLTVLGYGMGNYKDDKMQILSQKGNGNNAYIDNIQEANKVLVNEFGSTMYAVAKDVKLQVEFNPAKVSAYRLVGYETRLLNKEDFNDDTKDAGELGAGHTVTAFYEIVPAYVKFETGNVDKLKYQEETTTENNKKEDKASSELMTVKLRYKPIDSDKSKKMEVVIKDTYVNKNTSDDYSFASSVVMFAQLLRDSQFKGDATYQQVVNLAKKAYGEDENGYRHEFVRLVEAVEQMSK